MSKFHDRNGRAGFTIIEIMISISILLSLTVAVVVMMRSSIDVRQGLSMQSRSVRQLNYAMEMISRDIEHAFVLSLSLIHISEPTRPY